MGTKTGMRQRVEHFRVRFLHNQGGKVAQILHPTWALRDSVSQMAEVLEEAEALISAQAPSVKVVITGGGFLELTVDDNRSSSYWRSEEGLNYLLGVVREKSLLLARSLARVQRDYVVGVDAIVNSHGVGQFAVVLGGGEARAVAWKSFPVGDEERWLAGFGTARGRQSPRFTTTALGASLVLVCHDAQAFNHRNQALVGRARRPTPRMLAVDEMVSGMRREIPDWVFNLIHYIAKPESLGTFARSYKQLHNDYPWGPSVVGAFGYEPSVYHDLLLLSRRAQFPKLCKVYALGRSCLRVGLSLRRIVCT